MPDDPASPVLEVPPVGLAAEPLEDAEVDAEELGVDGVRVADGDALGLCVMVGVGVGVGVGLTVVGAGGGVLTQVAVPAALGTVSALCAALRLAVESVGVAVTVTVLVGVAVTVVVLVGVAVAVPVAVLVGVPLAVLLGGLVAGVTLGVADLLDLVACAAGDDAEVDDPGVVGHAGTGVLP